MTKINSDQEAITKIDRIKLDPNEYIVVHIKENVDRTYFETLLYSLQRIFTKHKGRVLIIRGDNIRIEKKQLDDLMAEIAEKAILK